MAEKKEAPERKATKKKAGKGEAYVCQVCGLGVIVDEICGCVETHEIICCGKPMKEKRIEVKPTKK